MDYKFIIIKLGTYKYLVYTSDFKLMFYLFCL